MKPLWHRLGSQVGNVSSYLAYSYTVFCLEGALPDSSAARLTAPLDRGPHVSVHETHVPACELIRRRLAQRSPHLLSAVSVISVLG